MDTLDTRIGTVEQNVQALIAGIQEGERLIDCGAIRIVAGAAVLLALVSIAAWPTSRR